MILVVGSTGILGSAVVRILSGEFPLVAHSNKTVRTDAGIESRYADLLDPSTFGNLLEGIDCIVYCPSFSVPSTSVFDPRHEINSTLIALTNLLEASRDRGTACNMVFASTAGAMYGETDEFCREDTAPQPMSSYGLGKLLSETILEFYSRCGDISYKILRFSNIYGHATRRLVRQSVIDVFLDDALYGRESLVWADATSSRDYLYADDAAGAVGAALREWERGKNSIFNVATGRATSLGEILAIVGSVTSGRHKFRICNAAAGSPQHTNVDASRFRHTFPSWEPSVTLEAGIRKSWSRKIHQMPETGDMGQRSVSGDME